MYSWLENIKHFPFSWTQDASQVSRTNSKDNEDFQRMNKHVSMSIFRHKFLEI